MSGWWDEAACIGKPLELFFPEKGGSSRPGKQICGGCHVQKECLADILRTELPGGRDGTFGGLSAYDREKKFDGRTHRSLPRTHCSQGHEFTEDSVITVGRGRRCKKCHDSDPRRVDNRTHCNYGHELTKENTYVRSSGDGYRECRTCSRERLRAHRAKRRERAS